MNERTEYVAGFMFDRERKNVALVRKNKPAWQAGKLNGIGGKQELSDADHLAAMRREFKEETGGEADWTYFCWIGSPSFVVRFFWAIGDLSTLRSMEAEQIEFVPVNTITGERKDIIENLPWLVGLAMDSAQDGRPCFATVDYPEAAA